MTLHLLDADVLIRAHEDYYPVDRVAPFWAWLLQQAVAGSVKMAQQNYSEIADSRGLLADWLNRAWPAPIGWSVVDLNARSV